MCFRSSLLLGQSVFLVHSSLTDENSVRFSTILIPLNLITGLWGMNVHVPGQDIDEGYVWFFSVRPLASISRFELI